MSMAWGSSLTTPEIIRAATGKPLDAGIFRRHLERRYPGKRVICGIFGENRPKKLTRTCAA